MQQQIPIRRNNLVATICLLRRQYSVSFEVKPTQFINNKWTNIIHFTIGGNGDVYGDRTPAVWFHKTINRLCIVAPISGNKNHAFITKALFTIGTWTTVDIIQFRSGTIYHYQIFINKTKVYDKINTTPHEFKNVKVFAGDNWYLASHGFIRNLIIKGIRGKFVICYYLYHARGKFLFGR